MRSIPDSPGFLSSQFHQEHLDAKYSGLMLRTITYFGLSYCSRGIMKGGVIIPLHNAENYLIGHAHQRVKDTATRKCNHSYSFRASRERGGKLLEHHRSQFVYNANRIAWPMENVIVAEGFSTVWWLTQRGYPDCTAVMSNTCSEEQSDIIVSMLVPNGLVWILTGGDNADDRCAESIFAQVASRRPVRWVKLPQGCLTDFTQGALKKIFWKS